MAKWRQRGCDSEVVLVVLSLIMLGDHGVGLKVRKSLKRSAFGAAFSGRTKHEWIHMIQIHESKPNGALSEVLPNRNCFGRAESLATARYPPQSMPDHSHCLPLALIHPSPEASMPSMHRM